MRFKEIRLSAQNFLTNLGSIFNTIGRDLYGRLRKSIIFINESHIHMSYESYE